MHLIAQINVFSLFLCIIIIFTAYGSEIRYPAEDLFNEGKLILSGTVDGNKMAAVAKIKAAAYQENVLAAAFLGKLHANGLYGVVQKSTISSLQYFKQASDLGHQGSTYNFGLTIAQLLTEQSPLLDELSTMLNMTIDKITPLQYFQAAYFNGQPFSPHYHLSTSTTTSASSQAHTIMSDRLSTSIYFTHSSLSQLWQYGSLTATPATLTNLWHTIIEKLLSFDTLFQSSHGNIMHNREILAVLTSIAQLTQTLLDHHYSIQQSQQQQQQPQLSDLQLHLVLEQVQDIAGILASISDDYNLFAAQMSALYAQSPYCYARAAQVEEEGACFNGVASSAMTFFRRAGPQYHALAEEFRLTIAGQHPIASTHWFSSQQTPRIYYPPFADDTAEESKVVKGKRFPRSLRAHPWWNETTFPIYHAFQTWIQSNKVIEESIQAGLTKIIQLQEGQLRDTKAPDIAQQQLQQQQQQEAVKLKKNEEGKAAQITGFKRIFTPYIGVREYYHQNITSNIDNQADDKDDAAGAAAGWSEFGPFYDGISWQQEKCQYLPELCSFLQEYMLLHPQEICGLTKEEQESLPTLTEKKQRVESYCGTGDTVVTLLRLKPGAHILPHCGTTNQRLILHILLRGGDGVRFRVGDADDKKEEGKNEAASTVTASRDGSASLLSAAVDELTASADDIQPLLSQQQPQPQPSSFTGWLESYQPPGPVFGRMIIFDDSFEHEVIHTGVYKGFDKKKKDEDRFVLLIVLRHPDSV